MDEGASAIFNRSPPPPCATPDPPSRSSSAPLATSARIPARPSPSPHTSCRRSGRIPGRNVCVIATVSSRFRTRCGHSAGTCAVSLGYCSTSTDGIYWELDQVAVVAESYRRRGLRRTIDHCGTLWRKSHATHPNHHEIG